ncbi:hypothetical protein [Deinococcus cellulosilyticus]|uniref:Uncharacterized protein n=1 Tax=Deinococcus cellulosilyticus (strain DSM 18568 / NBRC 106333 / KACC 11606 / 5516J-15) TaxID=1223518 RepID=A0A511N195_DEIC1|nr:hypothetical protein [Deinococcus cellulosilyticus]GEM46655.1 hypothetical protein DC3_22900 [Deinococcus cellulosilyticus NBRC 106333 = KACC 11606]
MCSHDMEDILSVMDGRPELTHEIQAASPELRGYLKAEFTQIMGDPNFEWWLEGFTPMHARSRTEILRSRLQALVQ